MSDVPRRAAVAAAIAGHDYQHLVTWCEVLRAVAPDSGVTAMTVEARGVGNVDDVVIERATGSDTFVQIKHAVDAKSPVGTSWLTNEPTGSASLLSRFHESWRILRSSGNDPDMQLVTDRETDSHDPLMRLIDRDSELLVPSILGFGPNTAVGKARRAWASHLDISDDELIAMLGCLRFRTGRPSAAERERAKALMTALGLASEDEHINAGVEFVRSWVKAHDRRREVDELRERVAAMTPAVSPPSAILLVEAIDYDPHPEDATVRLRWVDRFEGDTDMTRRRLKDPATGQHLVEELQAAANDLRAAGHTRVLLRGAMRQSVLFAAGASLREVRGFDVTYNQRGQLWRSDVAVEPVDVDARPTDISRGSDLGVVVEVATSAIEDVISYIKAEGLPIATLLAIGPDKAHDRTVRDGIHAAALARAIRDKARKHLSSHGGAERIHLFLAGPGGLSLLIGHRWNALAPTVVYEHMGGTGSYSPMFTVPA